MEWESCVSSGGSGNINNNNNGGNPQSSNKYVSHLPYLEILVQPQSKFRFRYKSEMTGKHGSLLGAEVSLASGPSTSTSSPLLLPPTKVFPSVKLHNFSGEARIRCSLVCDTRPHYPHPHLLEMGQSVVGDSSHAHLVQSTSTTPHVIPENAFIEFTVNSQNDYTAVFQGLNIIYMSKKDIRKQLQTKMNQLEESDCRRVPPERLDDLTLSMSLNVVCLYFEALVPTRAAAGISENTNSSWQLLCSPVVSIPIQHNKSTQTGDLRIVRIDKFSSCCTGNEEVFILVEKVDKHNIQVKFFQEDDRGLEIWKAYGKFSKLDVHHQYAIVFKTPAYRSCDIDTEVDVWLQLERPTDGATSQPIRFKYKPIERIRKMPKRQQGRGSGGGSGGSGRDSDNNPQGNSRGQSRSFPEQSDETNNLGNPQNDLANPGNNNLSGPSNIRQGSSSLPSVCDTSPTSSSTSGFHMASCETEDVSKSKSLAMSVALSICQGLHSWAETSDFSIVLKKLRHLLCLVNEHGDNALHSAIIHEQTEPFARILETLTSSPDTAHAINETNVKNLTPVTLAVMGNRIDFIQELVRHANLDLTITNAEGDTPIHIAVKANNPVCLRVLLQARNASAAINKSNYSGLTPLHIAVSNGFVEIVSLLCSNQADLSIQEGSYGRTPLHFAVEKESKESIISTLIILQKAGSRRAAEDLVNIQNYRGDTPLHCASSAGFTTLCALLLYHGGDSTVENHVNNKETEDEEDEQEPVGTQILEEASVSGQSVFDVAANDQVLRILKGTLDDWEVVLKACSPLLLVPSPSEVALRNSGLAATGEAHKDSESNKNFDSGIDINTFNSSQFLNSCSNQFSDIS